MDRAGQHNRNDAKHQEQTDNEKHPGVLDRGNVQEILTSRHSKVACEHVNGHDPAPQSRRRTFIQPTLDNGVESDG